MAAPPLPAAAPDLADPRPVDADSLSRFARDGHVAIRGVLTAEEVAFYRAAIRRTVAANLDQRHALEQDVAAAANNWQFVNNLWQQDALTERFVRSRRLARMAATLLGVERVRLFRDQSYFKGPGGAGTPWHQDKTFIPLSTDAILTAWIPLTDMTSEASPMTYADGSHRAGFLGLSPGGEEPMRRFEDVLRRRGYGMTTYGDLRAGDVAFHAAWTMHATYANTAPHAREAVVIVYFADGACVVHDPPDGTPGAPHPMVRQVRDHSRSISLPGLADGAPADGGMTPILYDRAWDAAP